ncbi:uncharacterized protein LOC105195161 [Solenopsis invicta]|uniref:uncharacterized protein LOC105195161 n=1 Tax=Solenopsis invicta TaxID=13686 RepID=UPI00193CC146|nr:uncharacterized protein LOC105195161 [Solenopsis invicta]
MMAMVERHSDRAIMPTVHDGLSKFLLVSKMPSLYVNVNELKNKPKQRERERDAVRLHPYRHVYVVSSAAGNCIRSVSDSGTR